MRLEQRIGRVDRIGQTPPVHAFHLIARGTAEMRSWSVCGPRSARAGGHRRARSARRAAARCAGDRPRPRIGGSRLASEHERLRCAQTIGPTATCRRASTQSQRSTRHPLVTFSKRRPIRAQFRRRSWSCSVSVLADETGQSRRVCTSRRCGVRLRRDDPWSLRLLETLGAIADGDDRRQRWLDRSRRRSPAFWTTRPERERRVPRIATRARDPTNASRAVRPARRAAHGSTDRATRTQAVGRRRIATSAATRALDVHPPRPAHPVPLTQCCPASAAACSEHFLEQRSGAPRSRHVDWVSTSDFRAWRERQHLLGPASSLRTLLEAGAAPSLAFSDFERWRIVDPRERGAAHAACARPSSWRFSSRVGRSARSVVASRRRRSRRRGAAWCVLFNGTHVRLVQRRAVFSRRFVEFDLDCAADDDRTAAAMWMLVAARALSVAARLATAALASTPRRRVGPPCRRRLPLAARRRARSVGACAPRACGPTARAAGGRGLRTGADDRLSHAVSVLRRGAVAGAVVASGLSRQLQPRAACADEAIGGPPVGLWDALRAIARLAHAGCRAGDLRVTPFNGRLFAPRERRSPNGATWTTRRRGDR